MSTALEQLTNFKSTNGNTFESKLGELGFESKGLIDDNVEFLRDEGLPLNFDQVRGLEGVKVAKNPEHTILWKSENQPRRTLVYVVNK